MKFPFQLILNDLSNHSLHSCVGELAIITIIHFLGQEKILFNDIMNSFLYISKTIQSFSYLVKKQGQTPKTFF